MKGNHHHFKKNYVIRPVSHKKTKKVLKNIDKYGKMKEKVFGKGIKMNNSFEKIYWNSDKNIPLIVNTENDSDIIKKYKYLTTDIRPVFLEEKHLLLELMPELTEKIYFQSVWANKQGKYFIDGKVVKGSVIEKSKDIENKDEFMSRIRLFIPTKEMKENEEQIFNDFVCGNKSRYSYLISSEKRDFENHFIGSEPFIKEISEKYKKKIIAVSFSGGKDSTVVSHLVRKALNNQSIIHVFGDTTLELPLTYEYVKEFQNKNPETPFLVERNDESNFFEISEQIGPPSRVKSWCCSIFKTGPMGTTFSEMDDDILMFYGIRRSESASRSKYLKVTNSPKIKKQMVASPIIDWLDVDIWLYILTEKLDFNYSYRQGFARVGCWCCPNNSYWSDFLGSIYNNKEFKKWNEFLVKFAKEIGKEDAEVYVSEGKWKARQGGAGLDIASKIKVESKECVTEDNARNYDLYRIVDDEFFELFKPFGILNFELGNKKIGEVYVLDKNNEIIMKLLAKKGNKKLRVTEINNNDQYIFSKIENQLRKFNTCIYCKACNSSCPFGAISVAGNAYKIDERLCTHCLKCINHFSTGCLISSSLCIKK